MDSSFVLFLVSLAGLCIGPVLLQLSREEEPWHGLLDGLTVVVVGGMVLLHLLPEALADGGMAAVALAGLAFGVPLLLGKLTGGHGHRSNGLVFLVSLGLHAALESAALAASSEATSVGLGVAIAAHRLPVGIMVYVAFRSAFGGRGGWMGVLGLGAFCLAGYAGGESMLAGASDSMNAMLNGFVAGALLHVLVTHGPVKGEGEKDDATCCPSTKARQDEASRRLVGHSAAGVVVGLVVLSAALAMAPEHEHHAHEAFSPLGTLYLLALQSAPALLVAYVLAGLLASAIRPASFAWMGKGSGPGQAAKGVLFGLPLPICSCGVLPLYETLVRHGVPATAALGFLIATPELGLDAVLLSIPLLGGELTMARVVAAFVVAMLVALVVGRMAGKPDSDLLREEPEAERMDWPQRVRKGLKFGLVELFDKTIPWIVAGLLLASLLEPLLDPEWISKIPKYLQVPLFAAIGIPVYVCASGATPLAAIAIHQGVGAGAAIAFLLAGPATNVTTFGILAQLHGRKVAIAFGVSTLVFAIASGLTVDQLDLSFESVLADHDHEHGHAPWWQLGSLLAIAGLFTMSLFRQGPRAMIGRVSNPIHTNEGHTH